MPEKTTDSPDNIGNLKEEVARLREEVERLSQAIPSQKTKQSDQPGKPSFGESLSEYVNDVVQSVMSGISSEIERSVFVDPTGAWFDRHVARTQARSMTVTEAERASTLMGAMASEHRLRILSELLYGGRYASEIESVLKDISPSTIFWPSQNPSRSGPRSSGRGPRPLPHHSPRKNRLEDGYTLNPLPRTQAVLG